MSTQIVIQTQQRDVALLEQMSICRRSCQQQQHRGASLPEHLVTLVNQTEEALRQHYDTLQTARSIYRDINRQVREEESELQRSIRAALQGVRRHQKLLASLGVPISAFGLTEAGTCPEHLKRLREPVEIAKNILNANKPVAASGQSVLRDPTAAELSAQIATIQTNRQFRKHARDDEQAALNQIRKTRILAQRVLRTVRQYIENMSIGLDKAEQRITLKGFGFKYITRTTQTKPTEAKPEPEVVEINQTEVSEQSDQPLEANTASQPEHLKQSAAAAANPNRSNRKPPPDLAVTRIRKQRNPRPKRQGRRGRGRRGRQRTAQRRLRKSRKEMAI